MLKLLTFGNLKVLKGEAKGFLTAIIHFAPARSSGFQVCAMASTAQCDGPCLNTTGHGGMAKGTFNPHGVELPDNAVQRARIARTRLFFEDRERFRDLLRKELRAAQRKAKREGLTLCVRPNGTSDIPWEQEEAWLFEEFPDIQFYDYTKLVTRVKRELPANYHLTLSYSEANLMYAAKTWRVSEETKANIAVVFNVKKGEPLPETWRGRPVVDGDETDLRFLDPRGVIVGLRAKGRAKKDRSGFVIHTV